MRMDLSRGMTLATACLLTTAGMLVATARADEPNKPTTSATEANPATPAFGHSIHGEAFNDGPRQKAYLMEGMGKVEFPITTKSPEAQAFMSQGVAQIHSFFYFEAERSFRQVAMLDPDCAMAYWGMAMANVNNAKRAKPFLEDARKRIDGASARERLYIDALDGYYRDGLDAKAHRQELLKGLEAIVQDYPEDINARAWLAMVTWQNGMSDGIGSHQAVDVVLDSVLAVESMHPGAHHYRIHLWDGVKQQRALKSAALFGPSAPGIAHAWHMPGHTYTGLKRYGDAAYQQEASARVDHAYMIRDRVMPFEIHNYAHNNQWLVTSLSHVGRVHDAIAVARDLIDQPRDPQKNGPNDGGSPQRNGRIRLSEVLVRYELWDDLIAWTEDGALDWSNIPIERKERAYTLGLAYAAKEDGGKLGEQIGALKALADEQSQAKAPAVQGLDNALAELEGYQQLLSGDDEAAFETFAKAHGMRQEVLARAHLKAKNFGFAQNTARQAARRHPNEVPQQAAYVEVLQAAGKTDEAQRQYRRLLSIAREADRDTPVFQRLAAIAAEWESAGGWAPPEPEDETTEADAQRIDLTTLGPLTWHPFPAEPLALPDTTGKTWSLADLKDQGKATLVIFYLGGLCPHCMQQLQLFGAEYENLRSAGVETIAVGTDDAEATAALKNNSDGVKFPMPLLADPKLELFHSWRVFDDFENMPLHGAFLVDRNGDVRFQRVSADPFLEVEFIKAEAARIQKLLAR